MIKQNSESTLRQVVMQRLQNLPMPNDESPRRLLGKSKSK
jgi:hypothetical protein